jgi:hypothetical protein
MRKIVRDRCGTGQFVEALHAWVATTRRHVSLEIPIRVAAQFEAVVGSLFEIICIEAVIGLLDPPALDPLIGMDTP